MGKGPRGGKGMGWKIGGWGGVFMVVSVFGGTGMKGGDLEAGGSDGRSGGRKFSVNRFSIQERVFVCGF